MQPEMENPASLAAGGAPNADLAGASINSENNTVVPFRKQALRTTDAALGQISAITNRVRDYHHTVAEMRAILAAAIDLGETTSADLDALAAEQGVALAEPPAASDWEPEPGAGLLGALSKFAKTDGVDA
jgi:plasmid stability protein